MFPIGISNKTDQYDRGFLRNHFTRLELGKTSTTSKEGVLLLRAFTKEHNAVLVYHVGVDKLWNISNYSYEDLNWDFSNDSIEGKMYHVTGNDRSQLDGDNGEVLRIRPIRRWGRFFDQELIMGREIIPLSLGGRLEGLYVEELYCNNHKGRRILLGDAHSLTEMPKFRGVRNEELGALLVKECS